MKQFAQLGTNHIIMVLEDTNVTLSELVFTTFEADYQVINNNDKPTMAKMMDCSTFRFTCDKVNLTIIRDRIQEEIDKLEEIEEKFLNQ